MPKFEVTIAHNNVTVWATWHIEADDADELWEMGPIEIMRKGEFRDDEIDSENAESMVIQIMEMEE